MSYDLGFYKHKDSNLTTDQIGEYLSNNLTPVNENGTQWFFENEDTEVYYSFETSDEPDEEDEIEDLPDSFVDFVSTGIAFNLNFIRPSFFGQEAFIFVETFINDLDLFVVNPQGDDDTPSKPTKKYLFENWNKTNIWASKEHFDGESLFYPIDKSNKVWEYNYKRQQIQDEIGEDYFVSKSFFFKETQTNKVVTLSMWTEHIPNILPITDYYLLGRKYKKLFKTVEDMVLLTRDDFNSTFSSYFEPYTFSETIMIHPEKAASIEKVFNSVKSNLDFKKHLVRIAVDSIMNMTKED
jgi:hypothetical protein